MELIEPIEELNKRLVEHFGIDTSTNQPIWRIVFSKDQYEMQLCDTTPEGFHLIHPEMQLRPKYPWIHDMYVLERLVEVPEQQQHELTTKLSYEPLWVFMDKNGNYLPPMWEAAKFAIDCVYAAQGKKSLHGYVKYKEGEETLDARLRVEKLYEEMYGNETPVGDALMTGSGVGFTTSKIYQNNPELASLQIKQIQKMIDEVKK